MRVSVWAMLVSICAGMVFSGPTSAKAVDGEWSGPVDFSVYSEVETDGSVVPGLGDAMVDAVVAKSMGLGGVRPIASDAIRLVEALSSSRRTALQRHWENRHERRAKRRANRAKKRAEFAKRRALRSKSRRSSHKKTTVNDTKKAAVKKRVVKKKRVVTKKRKKSKRVRVASVRKPVKKVVKIPELYQRTEVEYVSAEPAGTLIVETSTRHLYRVVDDKTAIRYGVAVGREGFAWSGEANVERKVEWPTWTPPKEMIARSPKLKKWAKGQPGGPTNPLGAAALYLFQGEKDTLYRIHGTNAPSSIGHAASSGCIRMLNKDIQELYTQVTHGTKVIVR